MIKKEILYFRKIDLTLYNLAINTELEDLEKSTDYFTDLVDSIISQQLSGKAAATIFRRFKNLFKNGKITPQELLIISDEKIRECGISHSKISYIKGIANEIIYNKLDLKSLDKLSDDEVISNLIKLKGIGQWTAEMFLIFTLNRPDVFSTGDLGLKNAIIKNYKLKEKPSIDELITISSKWKPYRTFASRILWKSLEV